MREEMSNIIEEPIKSSTHECMVTIKFIILLI